MRDLSSMTRDSMWITSQEGGNMIFDNSGAMTAPGTDPVTPVPKEVSAHPDPRAGVSATITVGQMPEGKKPTTSYTPAPRRWQATSGASS